MKNALMAVAITALMGGLVIAPVTQQSAEAQVYGGLKSTGAPAGSELLTLVGHGDGGGHFGGGHMGGGHFGGGHIGGGHMGGNRWAGGGGRHWGGGGGHPHVAYGGGGSWHGHHGNSHGHNNNWHGHANNWAYNDRHHRYYRYGRYYPYWYGGAYAYGYGYGNCAWLRRQALITNSPYWWNRYYSCIY